MFTYVTCVFLFCLYTHNTFSSVVWVKLGEKGGTGPVWKIDDKLTELVWHFESQTTDLVTLNCKVVDIRVIEEEV